MKIERFTGKYSFLSNFFTWPMSYKERWWRSSEHAYQAQKTGDMLQQEAIRLALTAGKAKRLGKKVSLRPDWEDVKIPVMREILDVKFSDPRLALYLQETGDAELIEGNTWGDTFWGVCEGVGENHLGKLLMAIREEQKKGIYG